MIFLTGDEFPHGYCGYAEYRGYALWVLRYASWVLEIFLMGAGDLQGYAFALLYVQTGTAVHDTITIE